MTTQVQSAKSRPGTPAAGRFGTFAGVFTPNVLTILGIILFLRTGWVVGQAGLWGALIIILLANAISFLTGLSLSAVSTSMKVKAGGKYYMISRSLGLEIGGAIGIPLYLSQAISVAFYVIGFTEALVSIEYFQAFDPRLIATVVTLIFVVIAYVGADFALRIQFFILAILLAALVSFFAGGWNTFTSPTLTPNYTEGVNFWIVFAVFFPAVTGIAVGASFSGDLKDPGKSIPLGTLTSIIFTTIIYVAAAIWLAVHLPREVLLTENLAMERIAIWSPLILAGVWASTLSSALGSVLAAPRTLQAIALDRVVPRWIASQMGSPTEPRMAVLISGVIAVGIIWMGDLNFVAPVITMFFLNTYGMINLVAGIEKLVGNPSFRPRFDIPWIASMLGAAGCYGAMLLISPIATVAAVVISYGIYFYLERKQIRRTWGDIRSGIWFAISRQALLNLEGRRHHPKNWRPNIVAFTGQPHNREQLVDVAEWLSWGRGMVTFFQLIVGDVDQLMGRGLRALARKHITSYIQNRGMTAFAEAEIVSNFENAALTIAQAHGIGATEPNSVLMGWSGTSTGRAVQIKLMRQLVALKKSVFFLYHHPERGFGNYRVINIWWGGRGGNADLMLLLGHLFTQHPDWEQAKINLLRIIDREEGIDQTRAHMNYLLAEVRVSAEPIVLVRDQPNQSFTEIIAEQSQNADLTLLGMQYPAGDDTVSYSHRLHTLVESVGSVLLIRRGHVDEDILLPE